MHDNVYTKNDLPMYWTAYSALVVSTALQDIFLSYIMFFIFDDQQNPTLFISNDSSVYPVLDVIVKNRFRP